MKRKEIKKASYITMMFMLICVSVCSCRAKLGSDEKKKQETAYSKDLFAMDTYMSLTAYGEHGQEAVEAAVQEINRLDDLWSVSSQSGEIYQINQKGTGSISSDTKKLLQVAERLYQDTEGVFDVTIYPIMDLWGFTTQDYHVPSEEELRQAMARVGQECVTIEDATITLGENQKLDLGAIAKGYTSNRIMEIYKEHGVTSGMVSLGGNVQTLGSKVDGSSWNIGIRDPESDEGDLIGVVTIENQAVITSGGYERYFEENGETYHHIIDPFTGYPAQSGLTSVSIVSKDGTLADGLSTSLFIMGEDKAIDYWKAHKDDFDAILVTSEHKIIVTEGLENKFQSDSQVKVVKG